jgi:hypothetical protein
VNRESKQSATATTGMNDNNNNNININPDNKGDVHHPRHQNSTIFSFLRLSNRSLITCLMVGIISSASTLRYSVIVDEQLHVLTKKEENVVAALFHHNIYKDNRTTTSITAAETTTTTTTTHDTSTDLHSINVTAQPPLPSPPKHLAVFHVGKTGGTTLSLSLLKVSCKLRPDDKKRKECLDLMKQNFATKRHRHRRQRDTNSINKKPSEPLLSKRTEMVFHYERSYPYGAKKNLHTIDGYIFTVREPLSRFESAYYSSSPFHCQTGREKYNSNSTTTPITRIKYILQNSTESQKGCIRRQNKYKTDGSYREFYDAFPSIEQIANSLQQQRRQPQQQQLQNDTDDNDDVDDNDVRILSTLFNHVGKLKCCGHITANYRYYAKWSNLLQRQQVEQSTTPTTANATTTVYAIRTEYLWHDAENIEWLLGGEEDEDFSMLYDFQKSHGSEDHVNRTKIVHGSVTAKTLCCALLSDMDAYRLIIDNAANLNDQQKIETYNMTWTKCGVSSWEDLESYCASNPLVISQEEKKTKKKKKGRKKLQAP